MLSTRLSLLVLVFVGVVEANRCASSHEDCSRSGCCIDPSKKCYKKNNFWASCRPSCTPGIHEHDPPGHKTPWSCEVIDEHHPDCATDGGNCIHLGCCKTKGHKCFLKDAGQAFCMASKPMWWIGHEIRPDTAKDDINCIHTGQCGTPGHKCFLKGTGEAFCRASRPAGWIGHEIRPHPNTAKDDINCVHTGQCGTPGHKCFLKGTGEAFCRASRPAGWIGHEIRPHPDTAKDDINCVSTGQCGTPGHKCFLKDTGEAFCRASRPAGWIGHEIRPHRPQNGGEGGGSSPEPKPQSPRWGPLAVGAMIATMTLFVVSLLWVLAAIFRRHTHVPKNNDSFLPTNNGSLLPAE